MSAGPYSIGSEKWPGLSKLIEECGEVLQVCGKIVGADGENTHFDGTNLRERLEDEIADLWAAISYVSQKCELDRVRLDFLSNQKRLVFEMWHEEEQQKEKGEKGA